MVFSSSIHTPGVYVKLTAIYRLSEVRKQKYLLVEKNQGSTYMIGYSLLDSKTGVLDANGKFLCTATRRTSNLGRPPETAFGTFYERDHAHELRLTRSVYGINLASKDGRI
jgi:hypothetical protein